MLRISVAGGFWTNRKSFFAGYPKRTESIPENNFYNNVISSNRGYVEIL